MSPIDPGHLDAMQYDFGEVAGNLAASSLPQNADLAAFSKSEKLEQCKHRKLCFCIALLKIYNFDS
jgi:hypothetical protein